MPPRTQLPHDSAYSCGWDLVHICNYRCPYCFFLPSWSVNEPAMRRLHLACSREEWIGFWERCFAQLGRFRIEIAGGEPFCHPDIIPLAREIARRHEIRIVTNLSADLDEIVGELDPAQVSFSVSFHPAHAGSSELLGKLLRLKRSGFRTATSIVAYPPYFHDLDGWLAALRQESLPCFLNPFQGSYAGREYPGSYTPEESLFLRRNTIADSLELRMRDSSPLGRLCAAARSYFRLWPDGSIHRCCATTELGLPPLGHIRDEIVPVAEAAAPCPASKCFAPNEVSCLLE